MGLVLRITFLTTTIQDTIDVSKTIAEYGILIVIAAMFLIIAIYIFRRMINSYTKTIDGIIPKLDEISKSINDLKLNFNEIMSSHNAHTNQSLRSLERDSKEIHESISHENKNIMEIESALSSLQNNYNMLLQIIISGNPNRPLDTLFNVNDNQTKNTSDTENNNGDGSK